MPRRLIEAASDTTRPTAEHHAVLEQLRQDRRQRGDAGGDRDRDRQDVIRQERRGGRQAGQRPEVVARDDVRAATVRIGRDRLAIADDDDGEDDDDRDGDRHRQGERAGAGEQQHPHDLLGGVRRRRDVVGGEDREAGEHAEAFADLVMDRERTTEDGGARAREAAPDPRPRYRCRLPGDQLVGARIAEERRVGPFDADPQVRGVPAALGAAARRWVVDVVHQSSVAPGPKRPGRGRAGLALKIGSTSGPCPGQNRGHRPSARGPLRDRPCARTPVRDLRGPPAAAHGAARRRRRCRVGAGAARGDRRGQRAGGRPVVADPGRPRRRPGRTAVDHRDPHADRPRGRPRGDVRAGSRRPGPGHRRARGTAARDRRPAGARPGRDPRARGRRQPRPREPAGRDQRRPRRRHRPARAPPRAGPSLGRPRVRRDHRGDVRDADRRRAPPQRVDERVRATAVGSPVRAAGRGRGGRADHGPAGRRILRPDDRALRAAAADRPRHGLAHRGRQRRGGDGGGLRVQGLVPACSSACDRRW